MRTVRSRSSVSGRDGAVSVADLVFVLLTVACFACLGLLVRGLERR